MKTEIEKWGKYSCRESQIKWKGVDAMRHIHIRGSRPPLVEAVVCSAQVSALEPELSDDGLGERVANFPCAYSAADASRHGTLLANGGGCLQWMQVQRRG